MNFGGEGMRGVAGGKGGTGEKERLYLHVMFSKKLILKKQSSLNALKILPSDHSNLWKVLVPVAKYPLQGHHQIYAS